MRVELVLLRGMGMELILLKKKNGGREGVMTPWTTITRKMKRGLLRIQNNKPYN